MAGPVDVTLLVEHEAAGDVVLLDRLVLVQDGAEAAVAVAVRLLDDLDLVDPDPHPVVQDDVANADLAGINDLGIRGNHLGGDAGLLVAGQALDDRHQRVEVVQRHGECLRVELLVVGQAEKSGQGVALLALADQADGALDVVLVPQGKRGDRPTGLGRLAGQWLCVHDPSSPTAGG